MRFLSKIKTSRDDSLPYSVHRFCRCFTWLLCVSAILLKKKISKKFFYKTCFSAFILLLFIHVLKRSNGDKSTDFKNATSSESNSQKKVHNLIRNCTIAATLSIASNIAIAIAYAVTNGKNAQLVSESTKLWYRCPKS